MEIEDEISQMVMKLDYSWYLKKKEYFEKEPFYNKSRDQIYECINESRLNPATDEPEDYEIKIEIDFFQYCWTDYVPFCSSIDISNAGEPINSSSASHKIILELERLFEGGNDISAKHKAILATIETVENSITKLLDQNNTEDYFSVLENFISKFREELYRKFGQIKRLQALSENYSDNLKFNLNQEQLGALLYIMYRADFFDTPTNDTSFLNFCSEHFYFCNQFKKTSTKGRGLRNKFNDAKNMANHKARDFIIQKLRETFDDL